MSIYTISNKKIQVQISSLGAELISLKKVEPTDNGETGIQEGCNEYIWRGKEGIWKRHSPVLFPLVGRLNEDSFIYKDKTYHLSQHGFARDMEFDLISHKQDEIWFLLQFNEETLKMYPFKFKLECGYQVEENQLHVMWRVSNMAKEDAMEYNEPMHFSIGAHPAFICPFGKENMTGKEIIFRFNFNGKVSEIKAFENNTSQHALEYYLLNKDGLLSDEIHHLPLDNQNGISVKKEMFDQDALIFEVEGEKEISIRHNGTDYVRIKFDAPVFGLWSPVRKGVPFLCIEPWYGRCDRAGFHGLLSERQWGNVIKKGGVFEKGYDIEIL